MKLTQSRPLVLVHLLFQHGQRYTIKSDEETLTSILAALPTAINKTYATSAIILLIILASCLGFTNQQDTYTYVFCRP